MLTGTVRDATTGDPLPFALVATARDTAGLGSNESETTLTDALGHFWLPRLPTGPRLVRASFVGYLLAYQTILVRSGTVDTLHIALQPSPARIFIDAFDTSRPRPAGP
jgi:hypothetical protein